IDVRDEDRGAEEEQDEAEERKAEEHVPPREGRLGVGRLMDRLRRERLRKGLGHRATSKAMAAKSRARERSEKWNSRAARRGVGSRGRPTASARKGAPSRGAGAGD